MQPFLPLFPLKMIVFPGEEINLHIFEPRYKDLIRECDENNSPFGIPPFINNKLMPLATKMEVTQIVKVYPKGEMDIRVRAIGQVRISEYFPEAPNKSYPGGKCITFDLDTKKDLGLSSDIAEHLKAIFNSFPVKKKIPNDPAFIEIHDYVHLVGMNTTMMYELYESPKMMDRQLLFLDHLKKVIPQLMEKEEVRRKIQMNGHFKNVIPPNVRG